MRIARLAITLTALSTAFTIVAAVALGAGGQYTVVQCDLGGHGATEAAGEVHGGYLIRDRCGALEQRLEVTNTGFTTPGQSGRWRFSAPFGTAIVGVYVSANLRRENHHLAQLVVQNDQGVPTVLANGGDTGDGFQNFGFATLDQRAFIVHLVCSDPGGCPPSSQAHAYAQNIAIVVADRADPVISNVSGSLLDGGWVRGSRSLRAQAFDVGSGLQQLSASVNGLTIAQAPLVCYGAVGGWYAARFSPCPTPPGGGSLDQTLDTRRIPFSNGPNRLRVCPRDFAGNGSSCAERQVWVDNSPPRLAFIDRQSADDPDEVRVQVSETHSGLATGTIWLRPVGSSEWQQQPTRLSPTTLTTRVDSSEMPPGEYEFRVTATDVAGNQTETTRRADGTPMILSFPLREAVQLSAGLAGGSKRQTISYRKGSRTSGTLVDAVGTPLTGHPVTIEESFGPGALIDRRVRIVTTDEDGRWVSKLPAGPSRTVTATFEGSQRYRPTDANAGLLRVRSRASFRTSRSRVPEGGRVVFSGRVGHKAARIPTGGKLIELQVRESVGRWNTVREAFYTKSSGRFRLGYRFGKFYATNASFRFRLKVVHEQGWPYKAPVRSRPRAVTVVAN